MTVTKMLKILRILSTIGFLCVTWDGVGAADGMLQLVNGDDRCSGRVEILHRNKWATVCDHGWDLLEADVVCLELGCGLAERALRSSAFGPGSGEVWPRNVSCDGQEQSLTQCSSTRSTCTHENDAGVKCSGNVTLMTPTLSLLSPYTVFSARESISFNCTVPLGRHLIDFHLYKRGVATPLLTQRVASSQTQAELTLSDLDTFQQGSYSCVYRVKGSSTQLLSSPHSNSINITVVELLTPRHWYNTSTEAPEGSVIRGHGFNITCSTQRQYPGGSFQLHLVRFNGSVYRSLPALSPSVVFTFPSAQSAHGGYYSCLYQVQLGGRMFVSRECQPWPLSVRDPDFLSLWVISWLFCSLMFVTLAVITVMARVVCLHRETRTCVDNTYVACNGELPSTTLH